MNNLRKFFLNKDGKIAVAEMPNVPLVFWLVFLVISEALHHGTLQLWAGYISSVSLLIWAVLEIAWGHSPFRRTLGILVLGLLIASRLGR